MANRHMPTSLRLMPRASTWADSVNTCTEVFSNWRFRRRRSGLKLRLKIIRPPGEDKIAQRFSWAKITDVQWMCSDFSTVIHGCRKQAVVPSSFQAGPTTASLARAMDPCWTGRKALLEILTGEAAVDDSSGVHL